MIEDPAVRYLRKQRVFVLLIAALFLIFAIGFVFFALKDTVNFFRTPAEITEEDYEKQGKLRIGGYVKEGTILYDSLLGNCFEITDFQKEVRVAFAGILPDLFREKQAVIIEGSFNDQGLFIASRVLAKHDENYIPKELKRAAKEL